ncbi:MAG TPA: anti-sigma factor [Verrucomicrobiae bacterium]|nr:anti-sigma factor [Verrucomicrobiae bacterium]
MNHEAFREMLPLYVIGALDGDELHNFERYIAENRERCIRELAEYQAVADDIALAAAPAKPSPSVYDRIAAAIEDGKRPEPAPSAARAVVSPSVPTQRAAPTGLNFGALIVRLVPWAAVAALAVVAIGENNQIQTVTSKLQTMTDSYNSLLGQNKQQQGGLADLNGRLDAQSKDFNEKLEQLRTKNIGQEHDLDALRAANKQLTEEKDGLLKAANRMREQIEQQNLQTAALQKKMDEETSSLDMFMDPTTRVVALADPKGESKALARVYWCNGRKAGCVVVSNCSPVPPSQGKCLELWAICGSEPPVAAGIGWTDDSGHAAFPIKLAKDMACVDKFAVTVERTGGVPAPEGTPVLIGQ